MLHLINSNERHRYRMLCPRSRCTNQRNLELHSVRYLIKTRSTTCARSMSHISIHEREAGIYACAMRIDRTALPLMTTPHDVHASPFDACASQTASDRGTHRTSNTKQAENVTNQSFLPFLLSLLAVLCKWVV